MNNRVSEPHVSIIILNWNGWQDTIECLESTLKLDYSNFNIILIDNNSQNESVAKILDWLEGSEIYDLHTKYPKLVEPIENKPVHYKYFLDTEIGNSSNIINNYKIIILKNSSNLGFAKANNQAIKIGQKLFNSDYFFLLNNDTVIDNEALANLITVMEGDKRIGICQSTIYNYRSPEKIANAGGKILLWGQTKYYKEIKKGEVKRISFINGCAFCIRKRIIQKYGLLSEKFFFGEEDFEMSMRMNRARVLMSCAGNSRVYHKIGVSSDLYFDDIQIKLAVHILNRLVDMKEFFPEYVWLSWKYISLSYLFLLVLFRYKGNFKSGIILLRKISGYSNDLHDVRKENFDKFIKDIRK